MRTWFFVILLPIVFGIPNNFVNEEFQVESTLTIKENVDDTDESYIADVDPSIIKRLVREYIDSSNTTNSNATYNIVISNNICIPKLSTCNVQKREDYHYVQKVGAYKLHTIAATFNDARKICNEEGGHLAIIKSHAEELVLLDIFEKDGDNIKNAVYNEVAFLGVHDLYSEGDWVTIFGDSIHKFSYNKWSKRWNGQPDNLDGAQHCGALVKRDGGMDDNICNNKYAFFCELPKSPCGY